MNVSIYLFPLWSSYDIVYVAGFIQKYIVLFKLRVAPIDVFDSKFKGCEFMT